MRPADGPKVSQKCRRPSRRFPGEKCPPTVAKSHRSARWKRMERAGRQRSGSPKTRAWVMATQFDTILVHGRLIFVSRINSQELGAQPLFLLSGRLQIIRKINREQTFYFIGKRKRQK